MLQTIQAKAETTAQTHATREKEALSEDLAGGLNTFFAQFMAAMPVQAAAAGVTPAASNRDDARAALASRNAQNRTEARALRQEDEDAATADARRADQPEAPDPGRAAPARTAPATQATQADPAAQAPAAQASATASQASRARVRF